MFNELIQDDRYSLQAFYSLMAGFKRIDSDNFWEDFDETARRYPADAQWSLNAVHRLSYLNLDSPIEAIFALHWMVAEHDQPHLEDTLACMPHFRMHVHGELFRPDFVVIPNVMPFDDMVDRAFSRSIVVELDGHDFHERTRQQVVARNRRDRALQTMGWAVCHFSGSEIVGDPDGCVRHVVDMANARGLVALGQEASDRRAAESRREAGAIQSEPPNGDDAA